MQLYVDALDQYLYYMDRDAPAVRRGAKGHWRARATHCLAGYAQVRQQSGRADYLEHRRHCLHRLSPRLSRAARSHRRRSDTRHDIAPLPQHAVLHTGEEGRVGESRHGGSAESKVGRGRRCRRVSEDEYCRERGSIGMLSCIFVFRRCANMCRRNSYTFQYLAMPKQSPSWSPCIG